MLQAKLQEAGTLKKLLDSSKSSSPTPTLSATKKASFCKPWDNSLVAHISVKFGAPGFTHHCCDHPMPLGVDLTSLTKVLRPRTRRTDDDDDDDDGDNKKRKMKANGSSKPSKKAKTSPKKSSKSKGKPKSSAADDDDSVPADVVIEMNQHVSLTLSLKYLVNFFKSACFSGKVQLLMSNDMPLLVAYDFTKGYIRYYLAPHIGDD